MAFFKIETDKRPARATDKSRVNAPPPTPTQLRAGLRPIITKGAFSLVWVNPNPVDDPEDQE